MALLHGLFKIMLALLLSEAFDDCKDFSFKVMVSDAVNGIMFVMNIKLNHITRNICLS